MEGFSTPIHFKNNSNSSDLKELIAEVKKMQKELEEIKNYSSRGSFFIQKIYKLARDWFNGLFNNTISKSVTTVKVLPSYEFETKTDNVTIIGDKIYLTSIPQGDVFYVLINFEDGTSEIVRDYTQNGSEITLVSTDFNGLSAEVKYLIKKEIT